MRSFWNLANALTLGRLALAPVVFWAIASGHSRVALGVLGIAALTDMLDGLAARKWGMASKSGQLLDPVADKVLLSCVYVALAWAGTAPLWFVCVIFGRDLVLLMGSGYVLWRADAGVLRPSLWGKSSTVLQIAAAVWLVAGLGHTMSLIWPTAGLTCFSAAHYLWRGRRAIAGNVAAPQPQWGPPTVNDQEQP